MSEYRGVKIPPSCQVAEVPEGGTGKFCTTCNRTLTVSSFGRCKASADGLQWKCMECLFKWKVDHPANVKKWAKDSWARKKGRRPGDDVRECTTRLKKFAAGGDYSHHGEKDALSRLASWADGAFDYDEGPED